MDAFPGIPKCFNCYVQSCSAERGSTECRQNRIKNRFKKEIPEVDNTNGPSGTEEIKK